MITCIYSHPDTCLHDHVNGVLELAREFYGGELPLHLLLAVTLHDFGKATREFQEYIKGQGEKTTHAFLSALYTLYVCKERLKLSEEDCFWAFFYVERHHGDIVMDIMQYCEKMLGKDLNTEISKLASISKEKVNSFISSLNIDASLKNQLLIDDRFELWLKRKENFKSFFESFKNIFDDRALKLISTKDFSTDFWKKMAEFSLLLDADKSQAGTGFKTLQQNLSSTNLERRIEEYKRGLKPTPLNEKREHAYRETLSCNQESKIYNLTLPTGMGKTLTGLAFAAKHKPERIIYALPFLSIVEQVQKTLEDMGLKIGEDFVVHHHLTEYPPSEEDYQLFRVLVEGWNTGIILTTFHQIFHTIFAYKNAYIRRLNKLRDSFIILDEVQALPSKYWLLAKEGIKFLTQELNCKVLYMTATQPYLTEGGINLVEASYYRQGLDRYRIVPLLSITTIEGLLARFSEEIRKSDKTYLFVLNTKRSSKDLYSRLKEMNFQNITYLSTDLLPFHRKERISKIKEGKYRIVVSTQLVEAGVDIDFDVVIRDIAPFDSIVQTAGRCNRNSQKGQSLVYVVNLGEGKLARRVYDALLIERTQKRLSELSESKLLEALEEYLQDVWDTAINHEYSKELLKSLAHLDFEKLSKFKLIEEEPYKDSVFVCLDEIAEGVLQKARDIIRRLKRREVSIFDAKREFEVVKPSFYSYVVNVKPDSEKLHFDESLKIHIASKELYDEEIGYTGELKDQIW